MAKAIEYTTEQLEAITKVETLIRDAKEKADVVATTEAKLAELDENRKNELRAAMPPECPKLRQKLNRIELKAKKAMDAVKAERDEQAEKVAELRKDIEPLVINIIQATVKTDDAGMATFVKGRDKADFAGLRALIPLFPAIKPLITTGDASIQLRLKKN